MPTVSETRVPLPSKMPFFIGSTFHDVQLRLSNNPELLSIGTTESITFGCWVYLLKKDNGTSQIQTIAKMNFDYTANKGYLVSVQNNGQVRILSGSTSQYGKKNRVPFGKKIHLAFTITGTTVNVFVNWTLVDTITIVRVADYGNASNCHIGSENAGITTGVHRMFGYLSDVFSVKSVLTAAQIKAVALGDFSGLGFAFKLDEGTGTTFADSSGNGVVPVFTGSSQPVWATTVPPQRSNRDKQCAVFNGTTSYATLPADIVPSTTNFNLALWFKMSPVAFNGATRLFCWETGYNADGVHTAFDGTTRKTVVALNSASSADAIFTEGCTVEKWAHLVITYTQNSAKLYINGTLINTDTSITMSAYAGLFTLGRNSFAATAYYSGKIADFVLHNAAPWSVEQVLANMIDGTVPTGAKYYSLDGHLLDQNGENEMTAVGVGFEYDYPMLRTK